MTDRIDPRAIADDLRRITGGTTVTSITGRAADTIDALVREMHARELHHFEVAQDRDALVAVVEKVRGVIGAEIGWESPAILIDRIQWALSAAPTDALAEHDAALIEGLADEVSRMYFGFGITGAAYTWGCKQVADRLRERARQVREGEA